MAELKDRLRADMTASMKARDSDTTKVLRAALTAIQTEEVSGESAHQLTADQEQAILTKQVRQRKDSAEAYTAAGRDDLAEVERTEVAVLQRYLPQPLTDDELAALVTEEVAAAGPDVSMKQMGQVIKAVNARAAGRAEGGKVAALVKARLQTR
ncbi:GatB/YqeY domain-containing protein [Naumannella sp. ID2617S]|nr:GatB/YqeY domain-containing protein [Naumannella sp. ID2617S]